MDRNTVWTLKEENKPETWTLEGYLRETGYQKYYPQVVEHLGKECRTMKHSLVLVMQDLDFHGYYASLSRCSNG
jgi:hypothetical protein